MVDTYLFIKSNSEFFILLIVYDIVITGTSANMDDDVITSIYAQFKLKHLRRLDYFLGIEVTSGDDFLLLNQKKCVQELLIKVGVS